MQDVSWAASNSYFATPQSGLFWTVRYLFSIFAHMYPSVGKTLILPISFCQPFSLDTGLAITSYSIEVAHSREVFLSICSYRALCDPQWGVVQICRLARFSTDADVDWKLSQKWLICLWHLHKIVLKGIYWIYRVLHLQKGHIWLMILKILYKYIAFMLKRGMGLKL